MSDSVPGRHRSAAPRRRTRWLWLLVVVAVVFVVAGVTGWLLNDGADEAERDPDAPGAASGSPQPSPSSPPSDAATSPTSSVTIETVRTVTVSGPVVTVEERSTVTGGSTTAVAVPTTAVGLELLGVSTVGGDGRSTPMAGEVTLTPNGSLTVLGRYRLTECPDLLPPAWPVPAQFSIGTRSYLRVSEPLHTGYSLCNDKSPKARPLEGLTGSVDPSGGAVGVPSVRLRWQGPDPLTVTAVGSISGVAALPVERGCAGECVAELAAGGSSSLVLQPVDPCPPLTRDDTLTLQLDSGEVVSVTIDGVHKEVCR